MKKNRDNSFSLYGKAVFKPTSAVTVISSEDIAFLRNQAELLPQKKSRLLMHSDPAGLLHEMLITHIRGTYIQPHINAHSAKSFLVLRGEMVVVLYEDDGSIETYHHLSSSETNGDFMIRIEKPVYHTVIILSDTVVFLETVLGPHKSTRYAEFAPRPDEILAARDYLSWLEKQVGI